MCLVMELPFKHAMGSLKRFAPKRVETEGKKFAVGTRKATIPAFIAVQSKFEEPSSSATLVRSINSEYQDVVHDANTTCEEKYLSMANRNASYDIHGPCRVNVAVQRDLHKHESDRSCIHLEFDVQGTGIMKVDGNVKHGEDVEINSFAMSFENGETGFRQDQDDSTDKLEKSKDDEQSEHEVICYRVKDQV